MCENIKKEFILSSFGIWQRLLAYCLSVCPERKHNRTCTHAHTEREEIIESIEMQNKQMRMTHNFNDRFLATINTHIICLSNGPATVQ